LNFLILFSKNPQKSKVMNVHPIGAGSFFENGQIYRSQYSFL